MECSFKKPSIDFLTDEDEAEKERLKFDIICYTYSQLQVTSCPFADSKWGCAAVY